MISHSSNLKHDIPDRKLPVLVMISDILIFTWFITLSITGNKHLLHNFQILYKKLSTKQNKLS